MLLAAMLLLSAPASSALPRKNVLMIAIDDMRPELSSYGFAHMHTPHTDALAAKGTTFTRAYVQVAVCMPSRQAIMTSRRPDTTMGWEISATQHFRHCGGGCGANHCSDYPPAQQQGSADAGAGAAGTQQQSQQCGMPDLVTLPGWFFKNGYTTIGHGKNFHEADTGGQDFNYSWSPEYTVGMSDPECEGCGIWDLAPHEPLPEECKGTCTQRPCIGGSQGCAIYKYNSTVAEESLLDGLLAQHVGDVLANLSRARATAEARGESPPPPFFVTAGFHRPHIPWHVPQKYFDLYPLESVQLAPNPNTPTNVPLIALQNVMGHWSSCPHPDHGLLGSGPFSDLCEMVTAEGFNSTTDSTFPFINVSYPPEASGTLSWE